MTDVVLVAVALAAAGWLLSRLGRGPTSVDPPVRPGAAVPPPPPVPPPTPAGTVGPAGPAGPAPGGTPAATGPEGRALDPWRVGDAAFVDGYIIGRYVERSRAEDDRGAAFDERLEAGDDGLRFGDDLDEEHGLESYGTDALAEEEGAWDDGFGDGFDDGFDDDDW